MKLKVGDFLTITKPAWAVGGVCRITKIHKIHRSESVLCDYVYDGEVHKHKILTDFDRTRPSTPEEILTAKLQGL